MHRPRADAKSAGAGLKEHGAMEFLRHIGELRSAAVIRRELGRLPPRALADLGLTPEDVPYVARVGARLGPQGASIVQLVEEARALRLSRPTLASRIGSFVGRLRAAVEATAAGRALVLDLVWRRAYGRVRAELASYSDRELMADLRLSRGDVHGIAVEGADAAVAAFIAGHPAYRAAAARPGLARAMG